MKNFKSIFSLLLTAVLSFCCGSVWADDYEIVFNTASSDGSTAINTSTKLTDVFEANSVKYVSKFGSECAYAYYKGQSGLKLGSSKNAGLIKMFIADSYKSNIKSITIYTAQYGKEDATISLSSDGKAETATGIVPGTTYTETFDSPKTISYVMISTVSKRAYVSKIVLTTGEGGGTVDPGTGGETEGVIFYESFDKTNGTGGNDNKWSGNIASSNLSCDNEGWTFVKQGGANKCAKFGAGSALGSAETPAIAGAGNLTLTFKAGAWTGDKTTLKLSATGATLSVSSVELAEGAFSDYTVNITGATTGFKIKFTGQQASNSRFFLDEVTVSGEGGSVTPPAEKTLTSISVAGAQTDFMLGDDFTFGGTVTATYSDASKKDVTADAKFSGYDMNKEGNQTVKVAYTEGATTVETTYSITISKESPVEPEPHVYASLAELVAAGAPTKDGYDVTVTLTNEEIKSIYTTTQGYRNGIYLDAGSRQIEIFCYDVPEDWVKGGTVSGTLTCPWKLYNTTWELCPTSWNDLTYTAPTDQPGGGDEGGNTPEGDNVSWDLSKASYAAASDEQVTWTNAVATMVADKAEAGTNANNYLGGGVNAQGNNITSTRFYKNSKLTITPAKGYTITAIVYDATSDGYATALATSTWTNATATANNKTVTITPTKGDEAISATLGGPTGASKITLYYTTSGTTVGLISNESTTTASPIYNLQGQRISRAQKGVNVVNGKKVIR